MTVDQTIYNTKTLLGTTIICIGNASLNGQCVTYIKKVLSWNGVVSAWKARGHAKDYGNGLVVDGLATPVTMNRIQKGDLLINPNYPAGYGHIALYDGAGGVYESNYAKALKLAHRTNLTGFTKAYRPTFYMDDWIVASPAAPRNDNSNKKGGKMITLKEAGKDSYWTIGLNGQIQNITRKLLQGEIDALKQAGAYFETTSEGLGIVLKANGWKG